MNKIALIYLPVGSLEEAEKISKFLLCNNLIACINTIPANSFYIWENEFKKEQRHYLILQFL